MKCPAAKRVSLAAIALAMLTVQPLVAAADGDRSGGVKVVQEFLTFNIISYNTADCDPSTGRPVAPNPTCVSSAVFSGTTGSPGDMTTLTPYLNEWTAMIRADGSFIYTDFTEYNVSIKGHGSGTFTVLETHASVDAAGVGSSENCVVPGSGTGDFVGMTGCGLFTSNTSSTLGTLVWKLHFHHR
jgi:hypothetical protein